MFEQHICILKGREKFIFVSPIFRKNIYVGVLEKFDKKHSPLDFFNIDYNKYPFAKQVKFLEVTLEEGDCMYVPAFYYIQSKTLASSKFGEERPETIMLINQY